MKNIIKQYAIQALLERGITGTYTFETTIKDNVANTKTLLDGMSFIGRIPLNDELTDGCTEFNFTVTV